MYGLGYPAGKGEQCSRCRKVFETGEEKSFVCFTDPFYQSCIKTIYGADVCFACLVRLNTLGHDFKLTLATITGLRGFLITHYNQPKLRLMTDQGRVPLPVPITDAVHVSLIQWRDKPPVLLTKREVKYIF
jgi:hypothetical protein